jgi:hypothetical protein
MPMRNRLALGALLLVAACGKPAGQPLDDDAKIVRAVLATLVSDGKPVCVDASTAGRALTVYREYLVAPRPSREGLGWHPPEPLRPPPMPTESQIDTAVAQNKDLHLPEPGDRRDKLPAVMQADLDSAAHALSLPPVADRTVKINASWAPKGVVARWWPINRLKSDCEPLYMLTNPARARNIAFVTVQAEHWGTTYALRPQGKDWATVAQWSNWIY